MKWSHEVVCSRPDCDFRRKAGDWLAADLVARDHRDKEGHEVDVFDVDGELQVTCKCVCGSVAVERVVGA